jgi:hypothetical protein
MLLKILSFALYKRPLYRLHKADHASLTYLMLQRQLSHLKGQSLTTAKVKPLIGLTVESSLMLRPTKAPIWGLRPDSYHCQTLAGLLISGALSDQKMSLSFKISAGP